MGSLSTSSESTKSVPLGCEGGCGSVIIIRRYQAWTSDTYLLSVASLARTLLRHVQDTGGFLYTESKIGPGGYDTRPRTEGTRPNTSKTTETQGRWGQVWPKICTTKRPGNVRPDCVQITEYLSQWASAQRCPGVCGPMAQTSRGYNASAHLNRNNDTFGMNDSSRLSHLPMCQRPRWQRCTPRAQPSGRLPKVP